MEPDWRIKAIIYGLFDAEEPESFNIKHWKHESWMKRNATRPSAGRRKRMCGFIKKSIGNKGKWSCRPQIPEGHRTILTGRHQLPSNFFDISVFVELNKSSILTDSRVWRQPDYLGYRRLLAQLNWWHCSWIDCRIFCWFFTPVDYIFQRHFKSCLLGCQCFHRFDTLNLPRYVPYCYLKVQNNYC